MLDHKCLVCDIMEQVSEVTQNLPEFSDVGMLSCGLHYGALRRQIVATFENVVNYPDPS